MISRRLVLWIGLSQLICWGISYYLIGVFGERMAADLGWSLTEVQGGFSASILTMGLASPWIGRWIDHYGGRPVMVAGSLLMAVGCLGLALAHGRVLYYAAWIVMGLAMRMTLYDAAFAALARIGGVDAKRPISQITLLGGLASTILWPIGHALADLWGWRGALLVYAGLALLTVPLHLAVPAGRHRPSREAKPVTAQPDRPEARNDPWIAGALYALIVALTTFLNSAMSAGMIGILTGLGMEAALAVWVSTLRGVGQSSARLGEVLFGARLSPLVLGVFATALLPVCFIAGLYGGLSLAAAIFFALAYGAGNGLVTIVRGTLPLVLFDASAYGAIVGRLLMPSFLLSALGPIACAALIERYGDAAALWFSAAIGAVVFAAAVVLWLRMKPRPAPNG